MAKQQCPECKGTGCVTCFYCKGSKVTDHPSGQGIAPCGQCDEDGEMGCERCEGFGELEIA